MPYGLDWDVWLGPAPERPYHSAYCPFKWRGWWDFGTGALGDMACHIMDLGYWSMQPDDGQRRESQQRRARRIASGPGHGRRGQVRQWSEDRQPCQAARGGVEQGIVVVLIRQNVHILRNLNGQSR